MRATERGFFTLNDLAVTALVHFAAAVSTDVEAGLNSNADQVSETLEQAGAEPSSFLCEFEDLFLFLAHMLELVRHQAFFLKLLQERVDEAGADFFSEALLETAEYAVAVSWSLV